MEQTHLIAYTIILLGTITITLRRKKNNNLSRISIMLIGLFLGIFALIYPLTETSESFSQRFVFSILYSFQCIYVGQDFELIQSLLVINHFSKIYQWILYFSFILAPILTTSFILSLIETFIHSIRCGIAMINPLVREIHIFSNINEDSITLAENLKEKRNTMIFCNEKDENIKEALKERLRKIDAITISSTEKDLRLMKKNVYFYEMSNDEIENMDNGLFLIDKYTDKENIKITIFSTRKEAPLLLDSVNRKVKVSLINKNEYALYNLFLQKPIIKYAKDKTISVLIMGEEEKALDMIKMTLWSTQLEGYQLVINVVGKKASHIQSRLYHNAPGLENYKYTIHFYDADCTTKELDEVLSKHCQDSNYIMLGFKKDGQSIETALFLRRYFLANDHESYSNTPQINIWLNYEIKGINQIGMSEKNYLIGKDQNIKMYFQIDSFGTREQVFKTVASSNKDLERHALLCHLANVGALNNPKEEGMKKDITTFKNRESTRAFGMALAIHMKNVLYTYGIDMFEEEITEDMIEKVKQLIEDENTINSLMASDARMWNCYARCGGFQKISFDEVTKYYKKITTIFQHTMAKLNPCLTDFDEFEHHEDETERLFGRRYSYIKAERNYIKYYPKILRLLKEKDIELK